MKKKKNILGLEEKILPTLKAGIHKKKRLFTEIIFLFPSRQFKNKKRQVVT